MGQVRELADTDVAWCAGVVDSIGLVRVRETDAGSTLAYVGVSTALIPVAERLAVLTGTSVTTVRRDYKRMGCSDHCNEPHLHVASHTARWSLTGARAQAFLLRIRPHLWVKAGPVDEVLALTQDAPSKPRTMQKMANLGWVAA